MKKAGRFLMSRSTFPGTRGRDISFLSPSSEAPSHAITPFGLSIFHLLKPYFWFFQCPNNYPDYWKPFQAMVQVMSLPLSILSYFPDFSACGFFFFKIICWILFSKGKNGLCCPLCIYHYVCAGNSIIGFSRMCLCLPLARHKYIMDREWGLCSNHPGSTFLSLFRL